MKINVGPGRKWKKRGWTTLDHYVAGADLSYDLRDSPRIELPSHSVRKIFCSHLIEHISDEAADSLFRECFRLLSYNGIVRFACPDLELALAQYEAGLCDPQGEIVSAAAKGAPSHLRLLNVLASFRADQYQGIRNTPDGASYSGGPIASEEEVAMKVRNSSHEELSAWAVSLIPPDATYRAHINAYWTDKLIEKLRRAGFDDVHKSAFRASSDAELRGSLFDNRPSVSLYVEARAKSFVKWCARTASYPGKLLAELRSRGKEASSTLSNRTSKSAF